MTARILPLALLLAAIAGCALDRAGIAGDPPGVDAARPDATSIDAQLPDARDPIDAPMPPLDAPPDAPPDGGPCGPCDPPMLCCSGACVDPRIDPLHCGGCGPCDVGPGATATCAASTCGLTCDPGLADCDGMLSTGCEADLASIATCRSCATACTGADHATPVCGASGCALSCDTGFADCDTMAANGCESDLTTTTTCGSCSVTCAAPAFATAACRPAGCGFTCVAGHDDCDLVPGNGCEADLQTDAMHCSACGMACGPGRGCVAGRCTGWTAVSTTGAPSARWFHSAVWTGTEMIVWGGEAPGATFGDGAAYDPTTNTWRTISATGAPSPRRGHTAVWTGTEMVIWGGYSDATSFLSDGAAYDPVANTWRTLSTSGDPSTRSRVPPVWTGTEMIIWGGWGGGSADRDDGARWRASTDVWTATQATGRPSARRWNAAVWTGSRMLVVHGESGGGTARADGFAYDPVGNAWSAISMTGAPSARARATFVYATGLATPVMIEWGGDGGSGSGYTDRGSVRASGGRYDPAANTWAATSAAPIPGRAFTASVWTGTEMIVWGGEGGSGVLGDGAAYDPVADTWAMLRPAGAPTARARHTAVWTGTEMIVFGGIDSANAALAAPARYAR